ncbi:MAG: saccharopine dehydrogenase C-terminal domain-containing protein [Candidatus Bathyarchaeia archaeon]
MFGSGLMGSAIARDLVGSKLVDEVTVYDVDRNRLNALARRVHSGKLSVKAHDVRRRSDTARLLKRFDVGVGALPHGLSEYAIESTIRAEVNFVDLIFGWRFGQREIHTAARKRGITIIPACGLAPGLTNLLAMAGAEQLDEVREVHIKVGGIPERPRPPLNYRIVFSFEAVLEEYLRKARIVKNGKVTDVPALTGLEKITFRSPIGVCECFYTDGLSTLVQTLRGVREMDEKTIRWPGHVSQIKTLIECGLLETNPVRFDGRLVIPRKLVGKILSDRISLGKERDLTLLRVDVSGRRGNASVHHRYEMVDHYDGRAGMTSMARTTAFPCSIAAQILGTGEVVKKGLVPPELAFRGALREKFLGYLRSRGMKITSRIMR